LLLSTARRLGDDQAVRDAALGELIDGFGGGEQVLGAVAHALLVRFVSVPCTMLAAASGSSAADEYGS
jgi:hypothetical protein